MELRPRSYEKLIRLIEQGVDIPNPLTVDIGDEVDVDNISAEGVKIFPGCRIYGKSTVICAGAIIGYEGPATVDDCQVGPGVELKGGYFRKSVFLEKSSMGLGAHVREACILEEQASGAHCVGLKQTILFPFVTLGSLINFCDCFMAGGTSRKNHSEVGSSYIHFNFTPNGDKTTPSLIGDVPRGVMLDQAPIFLGGQGGIVGPLRLGYGNVVAAGTILRRDAVDDNNLIFGEHTQRVKTEHKPGKQTGFTRIVSTNILYLANLVALEQWYRHVRRQFFAGGSFGEKLYEGALEKLDLAKRERIIRLEALADNVRRSDCSGTESRADNAAKREFVSNIKRIGELFGSDRAGEIGEETRSLFLTGLDKEKQEEGMSYIACIQRLSPQTKKQGVDWLTGIVNHLTKETGEFLTLFRR